MFDDKYINITVVDNKYKAISVSDLKSSINKWMGPCDAKGYMYHSYEGIFSENKYKPKETYISELQEVNGEDIHFLIRNGKIIKKYKYINGETIRVE
jgi:hypothetical protein